MSKIVICTLFCLLLLLLPTMTVGLNIHQKSEGTPANSDWTYLQGIITRPRYVHVNGVDYVEFNVIFVHYTTHWYGNIRSGFFRHFERILLPEFHFGWLGLHLVFAKFNVALIPNL